MSFTTRPILPNQGFSTGGLNQDQLSQISIASTASSSVSLIGALLVISIFLFSKSPNKGPELFNRRQTLNRIIFSMSLADLISAIAYFIGRKGTLAGTGSALCTIQAFMEQWGDLASICCTGSMALNVILMIFYKFTITKVMSIEKYYFIINFGVTFLIAIIPVILQPFVNPPIYGSDDLWCWIPDEWQSLRFGLFYIPLWLIFVFNSITYGIVGWAIYKRRFSIHENPNSPTSPTNNKEFEEIYLPFNSPVSPQSANIIKKAAHTGFRAIYFKKVFAFLMAFLLTWMFATLNRIHNYMEPDRPSFELSILQAITTPLRGFFNFVAYFLTAILWKI